MLASGKGEEEGMLHTIDVIEGSRHRQPFKKWA